MNSPLAPLPIHFSAWSGPMYHMPTAFPYVDASYGGAQYQQEQVHRAALPQVAGYSDSQYNSPLDWQAPTASSSISGAPYSYTRSPIVYDGQQRSGSYAGNANVYDQQHSGIPYSSPGDASGYLQQQADNPYSQLADANGYGVPQHAGTPFSHSGAAIVSGEKRSHSPLHAFDWLLNGPYQRPTYNIVEKTCEMICYLWFSCTEPSPPSKRACPDPQQPLPYFPQSSSSTASLQFSVSPSFVRFMQKVLEWTQVSQSVIVLSLNYIYRIKARNRFTSGRPGSEYRVALAAFILANKFVDDNTYTNKTWSDVSGIPLDEVNKMEKEFLLGIDYGLYVNATTYETWLNLLKGLIMSKDRESQQWHHYRWRARAMRNTARAQMHGFISSHTPRRHSVSQRARSSSPSPFTGYATFPEERGSLDRGVPVETQHAASSFGAKRSASDAFPPREPRLRTGEGKGKAVDRARLTLEIPQTGTSMERPSPSDALQFFSQMSLGASPVERGYAPSWTPGTAHQQAVPQTLVSAYRVDEHQHGTPQNLYFYTLAGSPMDAEEGMARKARLHYHQPARAPTVRPAPVEESMPMMVQSASASPCDFAWRSTPAPVLPSFSEFSRQVPPPDAGQGYAPPPQLQPQDQAIPSAPFANAGPPGYQFYASPDTPADRPFALYRPRGRRL